MQDYLIDYLPHFRLEPARIALLIVDMQYASASRQHGLGRLLRERGRAIDGQYRFDRIERVVLPTIQRLLAFFRRHRLRVVYVTIGSELPDYSDLPAHTRGFALAVGNTRSHREHEILDELRPEPGEVVVNKTTVGAFNSTGLDTLLRTLGIGDLAITGVSTNSCVETTARDAADRGYRCVLVEDGCGAARQEFHEATFASFRRLFGRVASADDVLAELEAALSEASPSLAGSPHDTDRV